MSRRRKHKAHANHERWLVSYADFITLLFAFFVVLYASSQADKKKAPQVSASIKGAFQQLGVFTGSATKDVGIPGSPGIPLPELTATPLKVVKVAGDSEQAHGVAGFGVDVDELRRQLESALGDEIRQHEVKMRVTPRAWWSACVRWGSSIAAKPSCWKWTSHVDADRNHPGRSGFRDQGGRPHRQRASSQLQVQIELGTLDRARHHGSGFADRASRFRSVADLGRRLLQVSSRLRQQHSEREGRPIAESIWWSSGRCRKKTSWPQSGSPPAGEE